MGQIVSGVQVSASFQIIPDTLGQLRSEVRVSVSFQSFAIRMFVSPVMFLSSRLLSPVPPVLSCFKENPQWRRCALLRVFYGPKWAWPLAANRWNAISYAAKIQIRHTPGTNNL